MEKKLCEVFMRKIAKTNQKELSIEKVIKRKGNKLYVKWKGYDSTFNSWINKNNIINEYSVFFTI